MSPQEAAAALNGNDYGKEGSKDLFAAMKAAGLVAVFGASDDLMEFRGAIDDEIGAYNGATAHVDTTGLVQNKCEAEDCPYHERELKTARAIKAEWAPKDRDMSWLISTDIPHEPFVIMEDGAVFCQGLVFRLADATRTEAKAGTTA